MGRRVTVVGLGPAGPELITGSTMAVLAASNTCILRTTRHPAAAAVPSASSCDDLYESLSTLDEVYDAIVARVLSATGDVVYAVPGSPFVAEKTVGLLRAAADVDVMPAMSCIDLAWARLAIDPLEVGPRIVDGYSLTLDSPGPSLVLQCDRPSVVADIKLSADDGPDVTVLWHLGLPDEQVYRVAWDELDRITVDHLTSLWIPTGIGLSASLVNFASLVETLRAECPWDRVQTHVSLRGYALEEAYEVVDAIDAGDSVSLEEELGDLLFQVFFHATLAAEDGYFNLSDVARGVHNKLVRRHPHVFGGTLLSWEELKRQEHPERTGTFDGIPGSLPALGYAEALQKRAASVGFDWPSVDGAWPKVMEEIAELQGAPSAAQEGELGDLLFACVNVARHLGIDPEVALRGAAVKFRNRFSAVSTLASERGLPFELTVLDDLWDEIKRSEQGAG